LPAATLEAAVTVAVTGEAAVRVAEENCTAMPVGAAPADSVTGELNPPCAVRLRVAVFEFPGTTERLLEPDASAKFQALLFFQLLTSRDASTEPSPVTMS